MKSYDQLRTEYDEALFALLMEEAMHADGEMLLAENERLKSESEFPISLEIDERMYMAIDRTYKKKRDRNRIAQVRRFISKGIAAMFAVVISISLACHLSPTVKARTLELIIQMAEKTATIFVSERADNETELSESKYVFDYIPNGFYQYSELKEGRFEMQEFKNDTEDKITIMITHSKGNLVSSMDTENADVIENISINGNDGLLVEKEGRIHIAIYDVNEMDYLEVICFGLDKETVIKVTESIRLIK